MFLVLFCSCCTAYIVRDNAKNFTSVGLSYKDVILFSKMFYVIDVVYVKLNSIFIINLWSKSRGNTVEKTKGSVL